MCKMMSYNRLRLRFLENIRKMPNEVYGVIIGDSLSLDAIKETPVYRPIRLSRTSYISKWKRSGRCAYRFAPSLVCMEIFRPMGMSPWMFLAESALRELSVTSVFNIMLYCALWFLRRACVYVAPQVIYLGWEFVQLLKKLRIGLRDGASGIRDGRITSYRPLFSSFYISNFLSSQVP